MDYVFPPATLPVLGVAAICRGKCLEGGVDGVGTIRLRIA